MASTIVNNGENANPKLTMVQARLLVAKNGTENLTGEQKNQIVAAVARDVDTIIAEARRRWVKKERLTTEQSALLMDWMWTQVDHERLLDKGEVSGKKAPKKAKDQASATHSGGNSQHVEPKPVFAVPGSSGFEAPSSSGAPAFFGAIHSSGAISGVNPFQGAPGPFGVNHSSHASSGVNPTLAAPGPFSFASAFPSVAPPATGIKRSPSQR